MAITYNIGLYGYDENDNVINYYDKSTTSVEEVKEFLYDATRYGKPRPEYVTGFEVVLDGRNMGGIPHSSIGGDERFTALYNIGDGSSLEVWFVTDKQRENLGGKGYNVNSHTLAYFPLKEHLLNAITYDTRWSDFTLRAGNYTDGINSILGGEKCFKLEGTYNRGGAYSELIPIPQGTAPRTVSCWLYPQAFNEEDNAWAYGTTQSYNRYGALHKLNPLGFGCRGTPMATSTSLPLNEWSNVIVTYSGGDSGVYKIYYMGELVGEQWLATDTGGTFLYIGYNPGIPDGTNTLYKGGINELFIEDREWTQGEIKGYIDNYLGKKKEGKQTALTTCKGISKYLH